MVAADADDWTHPPFAGEIADGQIWGRGAIDMKNMAAMSVAIMARLARERPRLRRDVIDQQFAGLTKSVENMSDPATQQAAWKNWSCQTTRCGC